MRPSKKKREISRDEMSQSERKRTNDFAAALCKLEGVGTTESATWNMSDGAESANRIAYRLP